ncbi:glycosyl transferase family 2 [Candidatus Woesearchaeota archaeon RBG_13_36_6]|nr:MAG: glycosyl transferase family 2 [Candidatus Woesearchaeota archaeon RBG_13_36_6]
MVELSFVIPAYNEEKSIVLLYNKLEQVLKTTRKSYEIIFVDDGSTDSTFDELKKIHRTQSKIKIVRFQRNFGKAAALTAGFEEAQGEIIFTMDADLQDDPEDIPLFLEMVQKGYDLVSGWRVDRKDSIAKRLLSRLYNWLTSMVVGLKLHDYNCGFKCYKKGLVKSIDVYGELHRYIPALAYWKGYKIGEVTVKHHKRRFGKTKYGLGRVFKGFLDLISIKYIYVYNKRPLHFFGLLGLISFFIGFLASLYLVVLKFRGESIGDRPMLMLCVLLIVIGVQFVSLGLLGEMITRQSRQKEYIIKEKVV